MALHLGQLWMHKLPWQTAEHIPDLLDSVCNLLAMPDLHCVPVSISANTVSYIAQSLQLHSTMFRVTDMSQVLRLDAQMQKLAEELKHENSLLVFGRGYNYATALEAALKVRLCHLCTLQET